MDVDTIGPGVDFSEALDNAVGGCDVLLALIGPEWTTVKGLDGNARLSDPEDFVRIELESALRRDDVRIIPVLVEGATMPGAAELPDGLKRLARLQAHEISDTRFHYDAERLVRGLVSVSEAGRSSTAQSAGREADEPRGRASLPSRSTLKGKTAGRRIRTRAGLVVGTSLALLLGVIAIFAIAGVFGGGGSAPGTSTIADDLKPSTLLVVSSPTEAPAIGGYERKAAHGSAWVYDAAEGLIVTSAHLVVNAGRVRVGFEPNSLEEAVIVGADLPDDLAVLRVQPGSLTGMQTLKIDESDSLGEGDPVFTAGFSSGGYVGPRYLQAVKGRVRDLEDESSVSFDAFGQPNNENADLPLTGLFQTTTPFDTGLTGGPIVDDQGRLVGIALASGSAEGKELVDAIPAARVRRIVPKLAAGESVAWLGLGISALATELGGCPMSKAEIGFCLESSSELQSGGMHENEGLKGGMLVSSVSRSAVIQSQSTVAEQSSLGEVFSKSKRNGYYMLITKIEDVPITTMSQYVEVASEIVGGQTFSVEHLDVSVSKSTNIGPFVENFTAP
jgi:S1-C subfamily serine protease